MSLSLRAVVALFNMPGSRMFIVLLPIFLTTVACSAIDLYVNYVNPDTGKSLDLGQSIYAVCGLLVFATPLPLPSSWITQIAFFTVSFSGLLLLGQGLVRIAFDNHTVFSIPEIAAPAFAAAATRAPLDHAFSFGEGA